MNAVSAPGKMLLGGEYAVLFGAEAIVTAVDRRAWGRIVHHVPKSTSQIVKEVRHSAEAFFAERGIALPALFWPSVRSSGFRIGKTKLGLGSSAAVAASTAGAIFEAHGLSIESHRADILRIALDGHRAAQGGRGSGADVAASVLGGTILYRMSHPPTPVSLKGLHIGVVFSGRSGSTEQMIARIAAFKDRDPKGYETVTGELTRTAEMLSNAYREGHTANIIATGRLYGECMDRLGQVAGTEIVTKEHRCAMTLAADLGGSAKPSGAGGGDIAVSFFDNEDALRSFRIQCLRHELTPLELNVGAEGLRREENQPNSR